MPAEPQTVALYLGHLAADSKAIATIEQVRAAISHAHGAAEEDTGNRWSSPRPGPPWTWQSSECWPMAV